MRRTSLQSHLVFLLWGLAAAAQAQALVDPTRPPSGFNLAQSGVNPAVAAVAPLVLESVLIHPDVRSAIISGERLTLGQKIRGLRLIRIGGTEVVLLDGGERRTLKLYPGVQKKPAAAAGRSPSGG
jgi:hypothetical protein